MPNLSQLKSPEIDQQAASKSYFTPLKLNILFVIAAITYIFAGATIFYVIDDGAIQWKCDGRRLLIFHETRTKIQNV